MWGLAVARPGGSGGVMSDAQNRRSVGPPRPPAITPQRATAALAPGRRHRHGVPLQVHRARAATDVEASLENGGGTAGFRLRRAQLRDAQAIGAISAEAFQGSASPRVDSSELREVVGSLEEGYGVRINSTAAARFTAAQERKSSAANEARALRLECIATRLRQQLAYLRGEPPPPTSLDEGASRYKLAVLRGSRMFMQFVAEDSDSGRLVGSATLLLRRVEAALPPPFPTRAPARMYLCNMAVRPASRRRGVARALLQEAQRLGTRWGQDALWLHVECDNTAALQLYLGEGFQRRSTDPWWYLIGRKHLLVKPLPQRAAPAAQSVGGRTSDSGVFTWSVAENSEKRPSE
eukprot:jgi/Tetstr1/444907/TSEL_003358.t1